MKVNPTYHVYIVECSDGSYYTGYTDNVNLRLREHNGEIIGGAKYTRSHRPVTLVYAEACISLSEAKKRESAIKKLSHLEKSEVISAHHNPDDI